MKTVRQCHIVHFTYTFFPDYLGSVVRIYNSLLNDGYSHLIFHHKGIGLSQQKTDKSNPIVKDNFISIPVTNFRKQYIRTLLSRYPQYGYVKKIRKWIDGNRIKPVLMHGHFHSLMYAKVACSLARMMSIPIVMEVHAPFWNKKNGIVRNFKHRLQFINITNILNSCNQIITQTAEIKTWLKCNFKIQPKINVIPNGVDTDFFCLQKFADIAEVKRRELNLSDRFVIFYAGHLDETNGIDFILNFIDENKQKLPNEIIWLFAGKGPLSSRLIKMSNSYCESIKFIGLISQEEMPIYYALSDLFIIPRPSNPATELTVPLKLIEMMSMQKMVLASSVQAIKNVIVEKKNGFLFNPGDTHDFLDKLLQIIEGKKCLQDVGREARNTALEKYDWKNSQKMFRQVYKEILRLKN